MKKYILLLVTLCILFTTASYYNNTYSIENHPGDVPHQEDTNSHNKALTPMLESISCTPIKPVEEPVIEEAIPEIIEETNTKESCYTLTPEEYELLAKVTWLEGGICSLYCQEMIVSVIFNRIESGKYGGNTLEDVIFFKNAFSVIPYLDTAKPDSTTYEAIDYVLQNGSVLPPEVRYFRSNYHFDWPTYVPYCDLDNVYFGYVSNWSEGGV